MIFYWFQIVRISDLLYHNPLFLYFTMDFIILKECNHGLTVQKVKMKLGNKCKTQLKRFFF